MTTSSVWACYTLDGLWGPHTINWFCKSSFDTAFPFSVDSFGVQVVKVLMLSLCWTDEMGWFFPPPFLVSRVIDQLLESSAQGTLVVPFCPSQRWWPRLAPQQFESAWFVVDGRDLVVHPGLFKRCEQVDSCSSDGSLSGHAFWH